MLCSLVPKFRKLQDACKIFFEFLIVMSQLTLPKYTQFNSFIYVSIESFLLLEDCSNQTKNDLLPRVRIVIVQKFQKAQ